MEASVAGNGQGQNGQGEAQADGGVDPAAIAQQFEGFSATQEEMRQQMTQMGEFLQTLSPQQQQEADQEGVPDLDLSQIQQEYGLDQESVTQLADVIRQHTDSQIQAAIGPVQQSLQQQQQQQQARDLISEFPALEDAETAQALLGVSKQYAEMMGQPELATNPGFWRVIHMAAMGADAHNAQGGDEPQAATLEGGAGAGPGGGQQGDLKAQILGGERGSSVLPF